MNGKSNKVAKSVPLGHDLRLQNRDKTQISASDEHQCSSNTSYNIGQKSLVETPHQS